MRLRLISLSASSIGGPWTFRGGPILIQLTGIRANIVPSGFSARIWA